MSFTSSLDGSSIGMQCSEALAGHGPLLGQGGYPQQPFDYDFGETCVEQLMPLSSSELLEDTSLFPSLDQLLVNGYQQCGPSGSDVLLSSTDIGGRGAGTSSDSGTEHSDSDMTCCGLLPVSSTTPEVSPVTELSMDQDDQCVPQQELTVECPMCSQIFTNTEQFKSHQKMAHNLHTCTTCLQLFTSATELSMKHEKRCKGPLVCPQPDCHATFSSERNCKRHVSRKHKRSESQPCEVCGKVLSTPANLKVHMLLHEDCHPISCHLCGALFRQNLQLQVHMDAYHAEVELINEPRPHECPEPHCDKSYLYAVTLKRHLRAVHQKERHPCSQCAMTFAMEADLQRHKNAVHLAPEEGRRFICSEPGCHAAFVRKYQLEAHRRLHRPPGYEAGGSLVCPFCPSSEPSSCVSLSNLRDHVARKHRAEAVGPDDPDTRRAVLKHIARHQEHLQEPELDILSGVLQGELDTNYFQ